MSTIVVPLESFLVNQLRADICQLLSHHSPTLVQYFGSKAIFWFYWVHFGGISSITKRSEKFFELFVDTNLDWTETVLLVPLVSPNSFWLLRTRVTKGIFLKNRRNFIYIVDGLQQHPFYDVESKLLGMVLKGLRRMVLSWC